MLVIKRGITERECMVRITPIFPDHIRNIPPTKKRIWFSFFVVFKAKTSGMQMMNARVMTVRSRNTSDVHNAKINMNMPMDILLLKPSFVHEVFTLHFLSVSMSKLV